MEELKMLVEMVAKLPGMALWVIALFWAYKVVVIGSIYGLIRFVTIKLHDYLVRQKTQVVQVEKRIKDLAMMGEFDDLMAQLRRVAGARSKSSSYMHQSDIHWLAEAIDVKVNSEKSAKAT